ncbi:MAG: hypothetical protein VKK04_25580 [Synechococcales bacterium]|nr:hypothetical protein [Synechococcales bacterium]
MDLTQKQIQEIRAEIQEIFDGDDDEDVALEKLDEIRSRGKDEDALVDEYVDGFVSLLGPVQPRQ